MKHISAYPVFFLPPRIDNCKILCHPLPAFIFPLMNKYNPSVQPRVSEICNTSKLSLVNLNLSKSFVFICYLQKLPHNQEHTGGKKQDKTKIYKKIQKAFLNISNTKNFKSSLLIKIKSKHVHFPTCCLFKSPSKKSF